MKCCLALWNAEVGMPNHPPRKSCRAMWRNSTRSTNMFGLASHTTRKLLSVSWPQHFKEGSIIMALTAEVTTTASGHTTQGPVHSVKHDSTQHVTLKSWIESREYRTCYIEAWQYTTCYIEALSWSKTVPNILHWSKAVPNMLHWNMTVPNMLQWSKAVPNMLHWSTKVCTMLHWS